jgi:hypothetical protein
MVSGLLRAVAALLLKLDPEIRIGWELVGLHSFF